MRNDDFLNKVQAFIATYLDTRPKQYAALGAVVLIVSILVGFVWSHIIPVSPQPITIAAPTFPLPAVDSRYAVPGDYVVAVAQPDGLIRPGYPLTATFTITNPDPEYDLSLLVYIPNPAGLTYDGGGTPVDKIHNPDSLVRAAVRRAEPGSIPLGVTWDRMLPAGDSETVQVHYRVDYDGPTTIDLTAYTYDGYTGRQLDVDTLRFSLDPPAATLPTPTPHRFTAAPDVPDVPAGRVLSPTMAVQLLSQSTDHDRAIAGLDDVDGADIVAIPDALYTSPIRTLGLSGCYFLEMYTQGRAALVFDTSLVTPDFVTATLRVRNFAPTPPGHTISIQAGQWEKDILATEVITSIFPDDAGVLETRNVTKTYTTEGAWPAELETESLAQWTVAEDYPTLVNVPLPREAINPGGETRLLLYSSTEAEVPPAGSCYTGRPGLGGAIGVPKLYIVE